MASGSGIAVTGGFSQLLTKDFEKVFFEEYTRQPEEYSQVAKMQTENALNAYKEGELVGMGAMLEKTEGNAISYETPIQGNSKEVTFTTWSLGFQITEEMMDDDLTGHMKRMPAELGKAAMYTRELEYWDIFNSATGTTKVGRDGKALIANDHPLIDSSPGIQVSPISSGTYSNLETGSLSQSTLESAVTKFERIPNERGIPLVYKPDLLLIPPELEWKAKELLLSQYDPESANNAINPIMTRGMQYMIVHFFTSTTAWFVIERNNHDVRFIDRKKLAFQNSDDFNTGNAIFKATQRFTTDFWDWRGVVGSTGA
jgi:phage major head subunit gpT-like protein